MPPLHVMLIPMLTCAIYLDDGFFDPRAIGPRDLMHDDEVSEENFWQALQERDLEETRAKRRRLQEAEDGEGEDDGYTEDPESGDDTVSLALTHPFHGGGRGRVGMFMLK